MTTITINNIVCKAIEPAFAMLPRRMDVPEARLLTLTIALQESGGLRHRRQMGNGPARGFWQFEEGGSVKGVMKHTATKDLALRACIIREVPFTTRAVWDAIEYDDVLAAVFARLNLWWSPHKLPAIDDVQAAWNYYIFTWRPGKPHLKTWAGYYSTARLILAQEDH